MGVYLNPGNSGFQRIANGEYVDGIADVVFLPNRRSPLPAMVVELKWNESASGALAQVKEEGYHTALRNYGGNVVLVGVSYDKKSKQHTCQIDFLEFIKSYGT